MPIAVQENFAVHRNLGRPIAGLWWLMILCWLGVGNFGQLIRFAFYILVQCRKVLTVGAI